MLNVLSTCALIMANMKSVAKQEKGLQAGTQLLRFNGTILTKQILTPN